MLYSPHITSPIGNEVFNLGHVTIEWNLPDPPSDDAGLSTDNIFYEIQFTENYIGDETAWNTIHSRLAWDNTSYDWKVGKLVKSDHVRIRLRTREYDTGSVSEWSTSSDDFTINVWRLVPPAIASPVAGNLYNEAIQIILDESLTRNTYNQKVSLYTRI